MTEYEQLQQLLTAIGVPHTEAMIVHPTRQPARQINIAGVELWFNSRGQFLQVYEELYDDHIEEQRTGYVLEDDDVVLRNAMIADAAYEERKRQQRAAQAVHAHERAERMAAYRLTHPLPLPGHARATLFVRAHALMETEGVATMEQAIDCIVQQDPELFQQVLDEEKSFKGASSCSS